jgi:hypothetical protein
MLLPPATTIAPTPDDDLTIHDELIDAVRDARAHARMLLEPDDEPGMVFICRCAHGDQLAPCQDCLQVDPDDPRSDAEIVAAMKPS